MAKCRKNIKHLIFLQRQQDFYMSAGTHIFHPRIFYNTPANVTSIKNIVFILQHFVWKCCDIYEEDRGIAIRVLM